MLSTRKQVVSGLAAEVDAQLDLLDTPLEELHCANCGRYLLSYAIITGTVRSAPCKRCRWVTVISFDQGEPEALAS